MRLEAKIYTGLQMFSVLHVVKALEENCAHTMHNCGCLESSVNNVWNRSIQGCLCKPKSATCDGITDCYPIQFHSDEGPELCG